MFETLKCSIRFLKAKTVMKMHAVAPNVQRYLISAVNKRAYI